MPKSSLEGKMWSRRMLAALHRQLPIVGVLDVGPGMGTYAGFRSDGQYWICMEAWEPYVAKYHLASIYDRVVVGDIRQADWAALGPLDLVICGDVLEHMSKDEALSVLHKALDHAAVVLVSIPIVHAPQGEAHGNPFERHVKDDWSHAECLSSFPDVSIFLRGTEIGIYLLSRNSAARACLEKASADDERAAADGDAPRQNESAQLLAYFQVMMERLPFSFERLREYCTHCFVDHCDDVVRTLEKVWARGDENLVNRILVCRLLVLFKERQQRGAHGLNASVASGPEDMHFVFTQDEVLTWEQMNRAWVKVKPASQAGLLLLAESLLASGQAEKAEPHLMKLRASGLSDISAVINLDPDFHAELGKWLPSTEPGAASSTRVRDIPAGCRQVVYAACDAIYFDKYGRQLATSFARYAAPGCCLALHIFDARDGKDAEIALWLESIPGLTFALSIEQTAYGQGGDVKMARGYYHAARFIRFYEFLADHIEVAGWLLDADTIVNAPLAPLFDLTAACDVALGMMPGRLQFNNQVCAGVLGVGPTARGRDYVRRVAAYIAGYVKQARLPWGIDQVAVYAVYVGQRAAAAPAKVLAIPPLIFDHQNGPASVLWATKQGIAEPG
jgi:hypothetical protein